MDGKIWHPKDGREWKHFDLAHQEDFSNDPRNIRFDLSTNGMNLFREMKNTHSTWPVIICIYNLPPWLCHKWKYLLLTTLIFGPKQACIDIDVFVELLMEDMQKLWEHEVNVWDEYNKQYFNLMVIILCMINDNPTHLALIGQVKGKKTCVICVDQTESIYLPSSSKLVYMWYHRFLPCKHRYHQWNTPFNGMIENEEAPKHRNDKFVFEIVKNINIFFGKPVKGKKRKKLKRLQMTRRLRSSWFSSYIYPIRKSLRLTMPSTPFTLRRVYSKVLSVCC
jgi:hypothetical protein